MHYKITLIIILSSLSFAYYKDDYEYIPNYEILDEDNVAYGRYCDGLVYIGDEEFLNDLDDLNNGDILINENEESMRVLSSYEIEDKDKRNDILCILKDYEENNKSIHNRSLESMRLEWYIHNLLYDLHIKRSRTKDVDFENNEENIYNSKVLKKVLNI